MYVRWLSRKQVAAFGSDLQWVWHNFFFNEIICSWHRCCGITWYRKASKSWSSYKFILRNNAWLPCTFRPSFSENMSCTPMLFEPGANAGVAGGVRGWALGKCYCGEYINKVETSKKTMKIGVIQTVGLSTSHRISRHNNGLLFAANTNTILIDKSHYQCAIN